MIQLKTERCLIRPFQQSDMARFISYRNNDVWMQHQGFKGLTQSEYEQALLKPADLKTGVQLAIISQKAGRLIGDLYLQTEGKSVWLGYTIHPDHARQGYASEAVLGAMDYLATQGFETIKAGIAEDNTASIELIKKLGYRFLEIEDGEAIYLYALRQVGQ